MYSLTGNGGPNLVELDRLASTQESPYGIITADCSNPKEIDDGVFVEALPTADEMYRVGVCVANTSSLYNDNAVFEEAMRRTTAKYWELPGGEIGYDPMIDPEVIKDLELSEGNVRSALIISFVVGGRKRPPGDLHITFGNVEVTHNADYKSFADQCRSGEKWEQFSRASAFILKHLRYTSGGDYDGIVATGDHNAIHRYLTSDKSYGARLRGSKINEAYMIGAGHLVGKQFALEDRPAIYRVHDPRDERFIEFMPTDFARYSTEPERHAGLNLSMFCRVTSPLRRLEDFIMNYQLWQRYQGNDPTLRERTRIAAAVAQLNRHIMLEILQGPLRLSPRENLGSKVRMLGELAIDEDADVINLAERRLRAETA